MEARRAIKTGEGCTTRSSKLKLSNGVDLIEIERVREAIERHGDRFLTRVYTSYELEEVRREPASLAARFAAKEAVAKALGCGIGEIGWREIEIRRDPVRRPQLFLYGGASQLAQSLGLVHWSVSLSHTQTIAVAFVIGYGE
jgi:holo-[acyl-carrier protein] synthase